MNVFNLIAVMLTTVAFLGFINARFIRLPTEVGLMGISLLASLGVVQLSSHGVSVEPYVREVLSQVDFSDTLMNGLLSFLLFAGAIQFRLKDLAQEKYVIGLLATIGVAFATFLTGGGLYLALTYAGVSVSFIACLIFGAMISPTDPVALLAVLRNFKAPKPLEMKIAGESLFNDGVAVVLFFVLVGAATGKVGRIDAESVGMLLLRQLVGGGLFGLILGWMASRMLRQIDDFPVEVLITLAVSAGGYALAHRMNVSGPVAVVTSALVIGNENRKVASFKTSRQQLESFWELINELLNAVLFVWIGLAVLSFTFTQSELLSGLIAIPVCLLARLLSIWLAVAVFGFRGEFNARAYFLMTWGGIRGGVSVALALALPSAILEQDLLLSVTYVVVVFSVLVQGLTVGPFVRLLARSS
jgi:CPA1 family monovalent cation:H+ antiporter